METLRRQMEKIIKNQDIFNKVLKHLIESIEHVEKKVDTRFEKLDQENEALEREKR